MRIVDLLSKDSILLNASPKNKAEAIDLLVDLQVKGGKITDRETYKQGILALPLAKALPSRTQRMQP